MSVLAERLFESFLAPLVTGGDLLPSRPIGGRAALAMGESFRPSDAEKESLVALARVRRARELCAVDSFLEISKSEWQLAACLHDLVQTTHPDLSAFTRRNAPSRLVDVVRLTLARIPQPATIFEALARHTLFARLFDVARTTTEVRWWTGKATFVGTLPPARLLAMPDARNVRVEKTNISLSALPAMGAEEKFEQTIAAFLSKTPLTDLATCERVSPRFEFSPENLAILATRAGRTLALRAVDRLPSQDASVALGKALGVLLQQKRYRELSIASEFLGERALRAAQTALLSGTSVSRRTTSHHADLGSAAGALWAKRFIEQSPLGFSTEERKGLLALLEKEASVEATRTLAESLGA